VKTGNPADGEICDVLVAMLPVIDVLTLGLLNVAYQVMGPSLTSRGTLHVVVMHDVVSTPLLVNVKAGIGVGEELADDVGDALGEALAEALADGDAEGDADALAVAVAVAVGEALGELVAEPGT
jgi:hypothetical protein